MMPRRGGAWCWLVAVAMIAGCDACTERDESSPIPEAPPPAPARVPLPEVSWPPSFRAAAAPEGTWGEHRLATDPTTGETWLASFDSSDEGTHLVSRWTGDGWETEQVSLPEQMGGSFLRFVFDARGTPHLMYYRVVGEIDDSSYEVRLVHAYRATDEWRSEVVHSEPRELDRASSVGWLVRDGDGEVLFAHRRGREAPTLVERREGGLESRSPWADARDVGHVLAFEVTSERTRFAWTDPTRSKIFVSSSGGPTRELHAFDALSIRRHVSAVFTPNGELHVAAAHHDNVSLFHLVMDDRGIRRSSAAPFAEGLAVRPMVSFDDAGALVAHGRVEVDGSAGELWLTRIQRQLRPMGVAVAPLETVEENAVIDHGAPLVDPEGRVFVGTRGWIQGPGTVWITR